MNGANACPVCLPFPQKTAADYLIEGEVVVFAREDPGKPFSYKAVKVLKGNSGAISTDLFLDSLTRRRLKANENQVAVLVRAGDNQPWRNLGIANEEYQHVVRRILIFAQEWNGKAGARKRCEFFLSLFGHKNRALSELAYLELGRAPYSTIKRVARFVADSDLPPLLERREYIEWRSLAILMLAQSADERDRKFVEDSFDSCRRFSLTTNLAAWATAFIELNEGGAIELIEEEYLCNPGRTEPEVHAVITALSVHGRDGHTHLRDRIVRSYGIAIRNQPAVAGRIAKDLTDWKKWEYRKEVSQLAAESNIKFETWEAQAIQDYLKCSVLPGG